MPNAFTTTNMLHNSIVKPSSHLKWQETNSKRFYGEQIVNFSQNRFFDKKHSGFLLIIALTPRFMITYKYLTTN
jgi:hypothetical protein